MYIHTYIHNIPLGFLSSPQSNCASELFRLCTIYKHPYYELCKFDYSAYGLEAFGSGWGPVIRPSEHGYEDSTSIKSGDFLTR
jgi:hypothetical protein